MHNKLTEPMVKTNLQIDAVDFWNDWTNHTMHDDAWIELAFRKKYNIILLNRNYGFNGKMMIRQGVKSLNQSAKLF